MLLVATLLGNCLFVAACARGPVVEAATAQRSVVVFVEAGSCVHACEAARDPAERLVFCDILGEKQLDRSILARLESTQLERGTICGFE